MNQFPISTAAGKQINRIRLLSRDWPVEKTDFKDFSKSVRNLTGGPIRTWRLDYDAIDLEWAETLEAHWDAAHGPGDVFLFQYTPYDISTSVRYSAFEYRDPGRGPNPNLYPFITIELEEAV